MGQGGASREEKPVEGIPPIQNKASKSSYRVFSCLGSGNFGGVYKCQHKKTKKFYAIKCVPVDAQPGTNEAQQQVVYQTAVTEDALLRKLDHPNIVKLHESFIINRNPISRQKAKKLKKGEKPKNRWFCLVLEYCQGNTLEAVIRKIEDAKASRAAGRSDDENVGFVVPFDCCLKWFIKLLETVVYIHENNIIHCDFHPENVLLSFEDVKEYKKISLKISDFGCAKDLTKGAPPRDLSGQIFYAATECVNQLEYDTRCDMWSLGIVFLNIILQMSMANYIKYVEKIFLRFKTIPELRDKLCERYKIKNTMAVHQLPYITLINFMHEEKYFEKKMIDEIVEDEAVRRVLKKMICPVEERMSAKDLLGSNMIQTWIYLMDTERPVPFSFEDNNPKTKMQMKDIDLVALITVMKIGDELPCFQKCIEVLKLCILKNDPIKFINHGGIRVMIEYMENLHKLKIVQQMLMIFASQSEEDSALMNKKIKTYESLFGDIISLSMKAISALRVDEFTKWNEKKNNINNNNEEVEGEEEVEKEKDYDPVVPVLERLDEVIQSIREYECLPLMEKMLLGPKVLWDTSLLYFTYLICAKSKTVRTFLCKEAIIKHLLEIMNKKNIGYVKALLSTMMSEMNEKCVDLVIQKLVSPVPTEPSECTVFKNFREKGFIYKRILKPLFRQIGESEHGQTVEDLLLSVIYFLQNFDPSNQVHEPEKLHFSEFPNIKNKLVLGRGSKNKRGKVGLSKSIRTNDFEDVFENKTKEKGRIEIVSSEPIVKVKNIDVSENNENPEITIAYYEIGVENGGYSDTLIFGFEGSGMKSCSLYLDTKTGKVDIKEVGHKARKNTILLAEKAKKAIKEKAVMLGIESDDEDDDDDNGKKKKKEEEKSIGSGIRGEQHDSLIVLCDSGCTLGCGLTSKGRVYFTRNNEKLEPMIQFFPKSGETKFKIPVPIKVGVLLDGNKGFKGKINFGVSLVPKEVKKRKGTFSRKEKPSTVEEVPVVKRARFGFNFGEIKYPVAKKFKFVGETVVVGTPGEGSLGVIPYLGMAPQVVGFLQSEILKESGMLVDLKKKYASNQNIQRLVLKIMSFVQNEVEDPSGIMISDEELKKLFNSKCHNEENLSIVFETSEQFVTNFGDIFVKELEKKKNEIPIQEDNPGGAESDPFGDF